MRLLSSLLLLVALPANAVITVAEVQTECDNEWLGMRTVFHGYMERHLDNNGGYPFYIRDNSFIRHPRRNDTDVNEKKTLPDQLDQVPPTRQGKVVRPINQDGPMMTQWNELRLCTISVNEWVGPETFGYDVVQEFRWGTADVLYRRVRSFRSQQQTGHARQAWRSHNWRQIDPEIPGDPDP